MRQAPFGSTMGWCNSRRPWTTAASTHFRSSSQYGPLHAVRAECGTRLARTTRPAVTLRRGFQLRFCARELRWPRPSVSAMAEGVTRPAVGKSGTALI